MKKILLSFLLLLTLCGCSSESFEKSTNHIQWLEKKCEQYVVEKTRFQNIWGVNQKLIDVEYVDKNLNNYKFYCQVIGGQGEVFRCFAVEILYDTKKQEIIEYTITDSYFYLW